ncbi:Oidioi.mRNA.OKI2018_I69.chr1.g1600.t1.cds [Oikopleura dioica]|uniref:Gypsy retrotransposon integrase-like protein 1 n=1 Tax=Oikopleura dioica TaxID=34765 RepID=A0ABN7SNF8_OIKDI|nr:Oidioi.mRNA.OKI2018_I69.chr1.g1600.t1.cds [Oikopleura dioica]
MDRVGPKLLTKATIYGQQTNFQLDTGAQVSCIPRSLIPPSMYKDIIPSSIQLQSYNGNEIKVYGCLSAPLEIGKISLKNCIFQIVGDHCSPILGTPELSENNLLIDLRASCLRQDNTTEPIIICRSPAAGIKAVTKSQFFSTSATSVSQITIKPNSSAFIDVCLSESSSSYICALPEKTFRNKNFEIYDQCIQLSSLQNKARIHVANKSAIPIYIGKNAVICHINEVEVKLPEKAKEGKFENVIKELSIGEVPLEIRQKLLDLIFYFIDVFAVEDEKLGTTDAMSYSIDTGDAAPVASQRYRSPYYLRKEMKRIIEENVSSGLLEPCSSPWAAPVLLVKKPNGKWRLVCDYRKLNQVTIANQYPLPEIDGLIDQMSESTVFSTADLFTGFHQIPCDADTKQKVAITTDFGQFTWTAMPMGGKNAPAVFQMMMDKIFKDVPSSELAIYLDDLCLHSKSYGDNLKTIEKVLSILRRNNLKIRAAKTEFLKPRVKFCGAIIENGFRFPNPLKTKAVREIAQPTTKSEAASIFGLLNYHRNFIPHFASKAAPINIAMSKGFKWTDEAAVALDRLKSEICGIVDALKIPNPNIGEFAIETDASEIGIGAALFYRKTKKDKFCPVAYLSQKFDDAQRNYNISEKELLAGKRAMEKWSHYLLGRKFTWFTDNSCVNWAHKIMSRKLKIAKWLAEISEFDFQTIMKPSKEMKISDCLSRQINELQKPTISIVKPRDFLFLQESDGILRDVIKFQKADRWPGETDSDTKELKRHRGLLCFGDNGELGIDKNGFKAIPPVSIHREIMEEYHDRSGHPGITQTLKSIEEKYFYPNLKATVTNFIRSCRKCQLMKPTTNPLNAPLGHVTAPLQPFEKYSIDLIGPLPITDSYKRFICVSTDLFSKRTNASALRSKKPEEVLDALRSEWLRNPHLPREILMDNGGEFKAVREFAEEKGLRVRLSPAYHPQTNGEVENRNRTIKSRLKLACGMENWDAWLPTVIHQMNSAQHSVTMASPFEIETGFKGENSNDKYRQRQTRNTINFESIREKIQANHDKRRSSDEKIHEFKLNDLVLCKNVDPLEKIFKWSGPLKITAIKNQGLSFDLLNPQTGRDMTRHISHLKPFISRPEDDQPKDEKPEDQKQQTNDAKPKPRKFNRRTSYFIQTRSQ